MSANVKKMLLLLMCLALFSSPIVLKAKEGSGVVQQTDCISPAGVKLKFDMRRLWSDHVTWTRNFIVSAVGGQPDQSKVLARLLQNQTDIGNAIKPYYGEEAGNQLAKLLKDHILIAGKILEAAKSGNQTELKKQNTVWYQNADNMANLLSGLNTNWSLNELRDLLHRHLQLVSDAVTTRIQKDWDADIAAYDKGIDHIMKLADVLADGIIKQFPDRF
ncbi:glycosyltransferase [Brevibacillus sp. GCM10020057]|uniref:glycosyltransferase n=1 Tax=Brevibacillus sp. GCM10020057 TaxID=3317327 RepID=UPI003630F4B9